MNIVYISVCVLWKFEEWLCYITWAYITWPLHEHLLHNMIWGITWTDNKLKKTKQTAWTWSDMRCYMLYDNSNAYNMNKQGHKWETTMYSG